MGEVLGYSYIKSYFAYKSALQISKRKRKTLEKMQKDALSENHIKILLAGHPYNLHDERIGKVIINYLKKYNITLLYSDRIPKKLINQECQKLSTDIHWTHSKEVMASISYYKDQVDGIILLSSFPCGPDSLSNELIKRKVHNIPILSLIFENLNSEVGIITRLESFMDILQNIKEHDHEKNH